jgi:hypothetical protein
MREPRDPVFIQYNIRNGLYIRPNSPNNQSLNLNTRGMIRYQINSQISPNSGNVNSRLNNTASSHFLLEEAKIDPTPTPLEEYK